MKLYFATKVYFCSIICMLYLKKSLFKRQLFWVTLTLVEVVSYFCFLKNFCCSYNLLKDYVIGWPASKNIFLFVWASNKLTYFYLFILLNSNVARSIFLKICGFIWDTFFVKCIFIYIYTYVYSFSNINYLKGFFNFKN